MGRGKGRGDRPEEVDDTSTIKSQVKGKIIPGKKAEISGLVSGKNIKGDTKIDIQESLQAGREAATDALNKQKIPRDYSKHARDYFDSVRD